MGFSLNTKDYSYSILSDRFNILGSFGYRGPGSDFGDHSSQRRVSGSWYGDSGDDASETSSICSERPVEVRF